MIGSISEAYIDMSNFKPVEFSISPSNLFYDWLYLISLRGSNLIIELIKFDAFTDIVLNPKKSVNTQARSVAIAKTLYKRGLFSSIVLNEFKSYFPTSSEDVEQLLLL